MPFSGVCFWVTATGKKHPSPASGSYTPGFLARRGPAECPGRLRSYSWVSAGTLPEGRHRSRPGLGYSFRATRSAPVPLIELLTGRGRLPVMLLTGMFWGRACPADCLCYEVPLRPAAAFRSNKSGTAGKCARRESLGHFPIGPALFQKFILFAQNGRAHLPASFTGPPASPAASQRAT
jgi:hypothetical protein